MEYGLVNVERLKSYTFKSTTNLSVKQANFEEKNSSKSDEIQTNFPQNKYDDPLMKWPLRGLAYTNEIGVAISEVAPALGTALWIPALMYFGADIYDKYKNEDDQYNPCHHRGTKQAVFQALASVILPTVAVLGGQKAFSLFGYLDKNKLSLSHREKISNYAINFISTGQLAKYKNKDAECVESFELGLKNALNYKKHEKNLQGKGSKLWAFLKNPKNALSIHPSPEASESYARETIDSLIALRKELYGDTPKLEKNLKWHLQVDKSLIKGAPKDVAIRDATMKFQKSQISKSKWIKTFGGFVALALAVKPIDKFVEHIVLPKVVAPSLDKLGISAADNTKPQGNIN